MSTTTETTLQIILSLTALTLLYMLLRSRTKDPQEDEEDYSGSARDPESLSDPTPEALSELDRLIQKRSDR
ncbi:MAG: hypothetical protein QGI73_01965 [Candidatus Thalassarchaeaceae archaeon]|jgi:hypothetical protein|nr:hypothetical protein [Euryarchaeota archaeon]MDP6870983.1 hypothetical protein [Candidatus Thalassarchaeaceae archaeon]